MVPSLSPQRDSLLLLHTPTGRDAQLLAELFGRASLKSQTCFTIDQLCHEMERGAGAVFISEEAFDRDAVKKLSGTLRLQGSWSDLPLLVLTIGGESTQASRDRLAGLDPLGEITLLERPLRSDTIVSAAQTALRARARQYEMRRRDAELQLVTDNVPVVIAYIDRDQVYRRVNQTYFDWFGQPAEGIVGRTIKDVEGEEHSLRAQPYITRALTGERVSFESQVRDRKKQIRDVTVSYAPDFAPDGSARGFVALMQDITERKRSENLNAFLVLLDDATRSLTGPAEITGRAAQLLGAYLTVNRCAYADVEEDQDTCRFIAGHNHGAAGTAGHYRLSQFGEDCLRLMRTGQPYIVADADTNIRTQDVHEFYRRSLVRSLICVPLRKQERLVAVMAVQQTSPRHWRPDEVELVRRVAGRCWEAIERARVERQMRASEEQFRTLANTIPNLARMAHPSGHIFWYNQRWYDYTGATPQDMEGWGWQSVHDPEVLPRVMAEWEDSIATGEPFDMVFPLRGADGLFRPFLTRIEPVRDAHGVVVRWFGTNTDIASQQEAERRLRAAVLGSPFPIMLHAQDGEIVALSRSWTELTGYTPTQLSTFDDWLRFAYPARLEEMARQMACAFDSTGTQRVGEVVIRTAHGGDRIWDLQSVPLGRLPDGRLLMMSAAVDVTERSRAEEALREREHHFRIALETARLGSRQLDLTTWQLDCSPTCQANLGLSAGQGLTFDGMLSMIHPEDRPRMQAGLEQALRERTDYHTECRIQRADGTLGWIVASGRALYGDDGSPARMVGVTLDITERKRAEEELRRSNDDIKRANGDLEEFAYVASHDLQEPLRMVNSYTQLLLRRLGTQANPDIEQYAGYIRSGVKRMEALIRDLLSYSRSTHQVRESTSSAADLEAALRQALIRVDERIRENGAEVTADPLPFVSGDEGQLTHVFQNLLSNALKYRKPGETPRIHIGAERLNGDWIVSFRDNGIGFDPSQAEKIFGLFKRLHRDDEYPGTGLGLAICKRIVERYRGRMWAESEEGVGSTFFMALPEPPVD